MGWFTQRTAGAWLARADSPVGPTGGWSVHASSSQQRVCDAATANDVDDDAGTWRWTASSPAGSGAKCRCSPTLGHPPTGERRLSFLVLCTSPSLFWGIICGHLRLGANIIEGFKIWVW